MYPIISHIQPPSHRDCVDALLTAHARRNLADANGMLPSAYARQHGHDELAMILE
jgi:hypothetical protein